MNSGFYVIYPSNDDVRKYINSIRMLAEESQRTQAHITVRGPYKKRLGVNKEDELTSIVKGEKLLVIGVGHFFDKNQNTVFFECAENEKLRIIWKKTSYKEYKPHITIYDGDQHDFSRNLFEILSSGFKSFTIHIDKISWLEPKDKEKLELFHLKSIIDFERLSSELDHHLTISEIEQLSNRERLFYISTLAKKLYHLV